MATFKKLPVKIRIILTIQSVAILMGASTHISWVIQNGLMSDEYNAPLGTMLFWDSLTFLDPLASFLLIVRPKIGLYLTAVIILVDVVHNNLFYFEELYLTSIGLFEWFQRYWMILGQILFALFVVFTFKLCLKAIQAIEID